MFGADGAAASARDQAFCHAAAKKPSVPWRCGQSRSKLLAHQFGATGHMRGGQQLGHRQRAEGIPCACRRPGRWLVLPRAAGCRWRRPAARRASPARAALAGWPSAWRAVPRSPAASGATSGRVAAQRAQARNTGASTSTRSILLARRRCARRARGRSAPGRRWTACCASCGLSAPSRWPEVEGIQPAGVAHRRAQRQRLAAGAGAEVRHHLAALMSRSSASSWLPSSRTRPRRA